MIDPNGSSPALAWLSREDGSIILGTGPFRESSQAPVDRGAFYVSQFFSESQKPWKIPQNIEIVDFACLQNRLDETFVQNNNELYWVPPEPTGFAAIFQEIDDAIRNGRVNKTVPVVTECGISEDSPALRILRSMAGQKSPLISYAWCNGSRGFAGATPERLVTLTSKHLRTMALAGTARTDDKLAFACDEKEIREHEYVAQTLVTKLTPLGSVHRKPREVLELNSIVHFHSAIEVILSRSVSPAEAIGLLHPTPALGPLPRTQENLSELAEWRDRLACPAEFGAPFGWLDPSGSFEAVVAIRGLWWDSNQLMLPAGCGVIEASRLVNEWRELRLKREAVRRYLIES